MIREGKKIRRNKRRGGQRASAETHLLLEMHPRRAEREPAHDRQAARAPQDADDGALRPTCTRLGESIGGAHRRKPPGDMAAEGDPPGAG